MLINLLVCSFVPCLITLSSPLVFVLDWCCLNGNCVFENSFVYSCVGHLFLQPRNRDRIQDQRQKTDYGDRCALHRPGPLRSPAGGVCARVQWARRVDGARRRNAQLFVLDRGQIPSPHGPPRHHRTQLKGRDPPVSGECPAPIQNQPASCSSLQTAVCGEVKPAAARGSLKPAVRNSEVMPAAVRGSEVKPSAVCCTGASGNTCHLWWDVLEPRMLPIARSSVGSSPRARSSVGSSPRARSRMVSFASAGPVQPSVSWVPQVGQLRSSQVPSSAHSSRAPPRIYPGIDSCGRGGRAG